ncbi:polysaccharide pyruvyl transferase family protein [Paenibacillus sp. S-38]|uniref:polysaccharide pyruvyl transferase family protein n=1 Tax=Paenibacillus sp. S-38 TaxID=3416710 RepID=UPI003CF35F55
MKSAKAIHPMDELKEKLKDILKVIPRGSNVFYLDYPVHSNGGDMLIMKGTEEFFKDYNINVRARYSVLDFKEGTDIPSDCIIVLHGGGNFGDIYPAHQRLREMVIKNYPNHRIVVMPQTIFYKSEKEYDKTAAIFNKHRDLHVYLRDTLCYELALTKFTDCNVYLSPDMAHQLWPIANPKQTQKDTLYFLRTDVEAGNGQANLEVGSPADTLDWQTLFTPFDNKVAKLFSKMYTVKRMAGNSLPVGALWYNYTDYLLKKAIELFSSYRVIKTSRLHGHILSCLMDKQNILIDNSYGKNSSYYYTWTHPIKTAQLHVNDAKSDLA